MKYIAVIIGGGLGSLLRFLLSEWIVSESDKWPWATFLTNIVASLLLGLLMGWLLKDVYQQPWKLFWLIGFCGGFSTFSTFTKETLNLFQSGNITLALSYAISSVVLGMLMVFAGLKISGFSL